MGCNEQIQDAVLTGNQHLVGLRQTGEAVMVHSENILLENAQWEPIEFTHFAWQTKMTGPVSVCDTLIVFVGERRGAYTPHYFFSHDAPHRALRYRSTALLPGILFRITPEGRIWCETDSPLEFIELKERENQHFLALLRQNSPTP